MNSLVSIIVPVYNVENYLSQCINSLISQSYANLEIILVNDGATDNSGNICDYHATKDSRIKVIHKLNGGLSDARNVGISTAKGDYISFIDSDDYVHPNFINELYSIIGDSDLAVCDYEIFTSEEIIIPKDIRHSKNIKIDRSTYLKDLVNLNNAKNVVAWNKLYKKTLWKDYKFVKGVLHEDEFAIHHIINKCEGIIFSNQKLYFYRQRLNSITSDKRNEKSFLDKLDAYYDRYSFYKSSAMLPQANQMLIQILRRCALPTVKSDNQIWKNLGKYSIIIKTNGLSIFIRFILLTKVISYPLYKKIISLKRLLYGD